MKIILRNFFLVVLSVLLLISIAILTINNNNSSKVLASTYENETSYADDTSLIEQIEIEMKNQNTSIVNVLCELKEFYTNYALNVDGQSYKNISNIVETLNNSIDYYERKNTKTQRVFIRTQSTSSEIEELREEIIAIAAGFQLRGWHLASELLLFNLSNTVVDVNYYPSNVENIKKASQILNDIAQNNKISATYLAESPGVANGLFVNTYEGDFYNSLGSFYYNKNSIDDTRVNIFILDRYDWHAVEEESLGDTFLNKMYRAEELGLLTPFYTNIHLTLNGVGHKWEYNNNGINLIKALSSTTEINCFQNIYDLRIRPLQGTDQPQINITSVANYAFENCNNISSITIPNTITSIGAGAFKGCSGLSSVVLPSSITTIQPNTFEGCSSLTQINIPDSVSSIGAGAFAGCTNLNIQIASSHPQYGVENNIVYNKQRTAIVASGDIADTLDIPATITEILPGAFYGNTNLDTIKFNGAITINHQSFYECSNLTYMYYYTTTPPTLNGSCFSPNYPFVVYIPYVMGSPFHDAFSGFNVRIGTKSSKIDFYLNGQLYATDSVVFWEPIDNLPAPSVQGYTFMGWYKDQEFTDTSYALNNLWNVEENTTLYAKMQPNVYTITLDANGGALQGNNTFTATYDSAFETGTTAVKENYTLEGWYDSNDVKYVSNTGESVRVYDKTDNTTLYAKWIALGYDVQIAQNNSVIWQGITGGATDGAIASGTQISGANVVATFKACADGYKQGKIFDHFTYNGQTIDWSNLSVIAEAGSIISITPVWTNERYTVKFFCTLEGRVLGTRTYYYGGTINYPPTEIEGYTFDGWYTSREGGEKINWTVVPDLTPNEQGTCTYFLYARYSANKYVINYLNLSYQGQYAIAVQNNNTNLLAPSTYTHGQGLSLSNITAIYLTPHSHTAQLRFLGWYLDSQFQTPITNISITQIGEISIYAKWRIDYSVQARVSPFVITDDGRFINPCDNISISSSMFDEYQSLGMNKLVINFYMRMREIDDGYQHIYVYNGREDTATLLAEVHFEYDSTGKNSNYGIVYRQIVIDLEALNGTSYLTIRYVGTGSMNDDWENDYVHCEIMFANNVADTDDFRNPHPVHFYWRNLYPFDDETLTNY